ncbi:hypothetical protein [Pseudomonas viridiflava]|uniref:hypothetical protein n=1 Tax=Pseudomonas viridiflava TaxID=33069 RepID=UPI000F06B1E1|nr:hypothetical protein [Pseudomonas viridiflava]
MGYKETKNLAAPILPQAVDGKLSKRDIQETGGHVRVPVYDFMAIGDRVTLHLKGEPHEGPITFPEIKDVTAVAPIDFQMTYVGHLVSWETLDVHYEVINKQGTDKGTSDLVTVSII